MKLSIFLILILSVTVCSEQETADQQPTQQVENISKFLLELIGRYDQSGIGAIPIDKYPRFLADVLVKGHLSVTPNATVTQDLQLLLLTATTDFVKKYNTTEVGVQDFYFDLVKQFTVYLLEHEEEYTPIIETFFGDTPYSQEPKQNDSSNQESNEPEAEVINQEKIDL